MEKKAPTFVYLFNYSNRGAMRLNYGAGVVATGSRKILLIPLNYTYWTDFDKIVPLIHDGADLYVFEMPSLMDTD